MTSDPQTRLSYQLSPVNPRVQQFLKLLALGLMLVDHVHLVFFDRQLEWLYWLSRLVFPIFALIVAQNLEQHHTNPRRYISRLFVYGLLAQPFYFGCFHTLQLNVLFTLASSVATYTTMQELKTRKAFWALRWGLALTIASSLPFLEFGWAGVLAVPAFAALMRRGAWSDWLACFALSFGIVGFTSPWPMPLVAVGLWAIAARFGTADSWQPAIWIKHAYYTFYPVHLAIIALVSTVAKA